MKKLTTIIILLFILLSGNHYANAQWTIGGNDLSSDGILGSSVGGDPWDVIFVTSGLTRMKIASSGKVGIGDFSATDPSYFLDLRNSLAARSLYLTNDYNSSVSKYGLYSSIGDIGTGSRYGIYSTTTSNASSSATNYGIYSTVSHPGSGPAYGFYSIVQSGGTGPHYGLYANSSGSNNYAVYGVGRGYFSDKVGLGITSPVGQLHIKDVEVDLTTGGSLIIGQTSDVNMAFDANEIHARDNGAASTLYLNPKGKPVVVNNSGVLDDLTLSTDGAFRIGGTDANNLAFDGNEIQARSNGAASVLKLNELGGSVCIGTASATEKLNVCGGIRATEIKVESGWCDYVFKQNYNLRPLSEVAEYISTNKHLPNIPPAAEVENGGLSLGDMSKRMMEKIEELTLYLIQQDQQIKALQADNSSMKKQLDEIASR